MTEIWQEIVQSNTFNFIIVAGILLFILMKLNIKSKITEQQEQIKNYVKTSEFEKASAEEELRAAENKISNLETETNEIKRSANKSITSLKNKTERDISRKKQDIITGAERILSLEEKQFKSKLTGILTKKSVELARNNITEQIEGNQKLHDKYIEEAIEELDKINL